jgi:putative DNA primase/helicase
MMMTTTPNQAPTEVDPVTGGSPQALRQQEADTIARLAALKPVEFDQVRKEEAKAMGIQVKTLDDLVKAARAEEGAAVRLPFADHEPAEEPVDPASLLTEVAAVIREFIVLEPEQADAAALWLSHTHLTEVAETSPIAIINAPERACAKTLFQTVLGRMAHRPLPASNASLSALFRAIESWGPTLFIDEADTFFRDNSELHGMVNAGYKRGGYVLRSEATGDSFEPRMFSVYGAKSIAGIALEKHLPDATMSRGIVFNMRRKLPGELVRRLRHADGKIFERLASQLVRFAEDYSQQVRLARPNLPDELSDRAQDNWEPLIAIAQCAGPAWVQRATQAALKMSVASEAMTSTGNELLADIKDVFDRWSKPTIKSVDLIEKLTDDGELGWATYNRGKPITPRQLAKQLAVYGIKPKTVRQPKTPLEPHGSTPKGYEVADFSDAFERYLKPVRAQPVAGHPPEATAIVVTRAEEVADTPQRPPEKMPDQGCGGVADTSVERDGDDPSAAY